MWTSFEYLVGSWQGTGSGQSGNGQYERTYKRILNDQYLFVKNKSIYPVQDRNPQGEVHEDWGFISYDKQRKIFVYRQFHSEGFVNQYKLEPAAEYSLVLVFTNEGIENIPAVWRAKETCRRISPDEFVETFELAAPGEDFEVYSESHLS